MDPATSNAILTTKWCFDGYKAGRKLKHGSIDDLWEEMWDTWDAIYQAEWIVSFHKLVGNPNAHASYAYAWLKAIHVDRD